MGRNVGVILGSCLVACAPSPRDEDALSGGIGTGSASASSGASAGDGTGPGDLLDLGLPPTAGDEGPGGEGCEKVDFLFVIDNSGSMGDEQQNLANSFPSFIATITAEVVSDFHILTTDMDAADKWVDKYDKCSNKCIGEEDSKVCSLGTLGTTTCGELPAMGPTACDGTLGAGRVYSQDVPPIDCAIDGGRRYLTDTQADLGGTFACLATMGAWGGGELGMASMLAAVGPANNGVGGCNEGFLRDDAVLVVTVISDEEDFQDSPGEPGSWRSDLLALKGGNETAVVVLGLVGDTALPGAVCPPDSIPGSTGAEDSPRLRSFVESFGERGFLGSVCAADYGPFFADAVAVIDAACDDYVPEG